MLLKLLFLNIKFNLYTYLNILVSIANHHYQKVLGSLVSKMHTHRSLKLSLFIDEWAKAITCSEG